jgi:hypothetical protein
VTTQTLQHLSVTRPAVRTESFADSYSLFALIVMSMFVLAVAFAIVGLTMPSWLGFS